MGEGLHPGWDARVQQQQVVGCQRHPRTRLFDDAPAFEL